MSDRPDFRFSLAGVEDREHLLDLHRTIRQEIDAVLEPEYTAANQKSTYYQRIWHENFPTADGSLPVIKAVVNHEIVGFSRFGNLLANEYSDEKLGEFRQGLGELHQLYVRRDYRRQHGLGRMLYRSALEGLKKAGYRHMLIALIEKNTDARKFYERMGAQHHHTYLDNLVRNGVTYRKNVAVYIHENIGV